MPVDSWLPVGYELPCGSTLSIPIDGDTDWQICRIQDGGRALIVQNGLAKKWLKSDLLHSSAMHVFSFGDSELQSLSSGGGHILSAVHHCSSPETMNEAIAFAQAFKATREKVPDAGLQRSIYCERISRLLPTYTLEADVADDVVFGAWLSGGVAVSVYSFRRMCALINWVDQAQVRKLIDRAGFTTPVADNEQSEIEISKLDSGAFELAGRPELQQFFREHVIDIVENPDRYAALGIEFPSAIVLHGPPGCGKTFGVERLVEYLDWPSFEIQASSVASPYIHETSRKVAEVFETAMNNVPSVLIIDEMEAFLPDRQASSGSGQHRVEEVAEFLRRIPEAIKNRVLVVAMTNHIDMIDPAILRRGRFDHIVEVGPAGAEEIQGLLEKLIGDLPAEPNVDVGPLAKMLEGRALSDVAYVVREAARLSARAGKDRIGQQGLLTAIENSPARLKDVHEPRKIGFVWDSD